MLILSNLFFFILENAKHPETLYYTQAKENTKEIQADIHKGGETAQDEWLMNLIWYSENHYSHQDQGN